MKEKATFLQAAYHVLKEAKAPLSAAEITDIALRKKMLISEGKTPHLSMRARLSTDILKNKEASLFKRSESGKFALREWGSDEYISPRFTKAIFDEDIVVFERKYLAEFAKKKGLLDFDLNLLAQKLNSLCFSIRRKDAEINEDLIQLISVFITQFNNEFLTFKRTKRLPEKRLHGFYSIAFGGHITPTDLLPLLNVFDPTEEPIFIIRELTEELRLKASPVIKYRGLIYDNSVQVSRIHLGIVYDVFLEDRSFSIGERGFLVDPKFEDIETIFNRKEQFENWSQMIIEYERKRR